MSDIDDEVRRFSRLLASQRGSSGIQPRPIIDVSESSFEPESVDLGFNTPPRSEPIGGGGGGGGGIFPPSTGACCQGTTCTVETPAHCADLGGVYQGTGVPCSPNPCVSVCPPANPCTLDFTVSGPNGYNETIVGFLLQDGTDCAGAGAVGTWTLTPWLGDDPINGGCYSTTCGQHFDICDDPDVHSCRCGMVGTWRSDEAHNRSRVQLRLAKIIGDPLYPFDGWWLLAQVIEFYGDVTSGCIYGGCQFFEPTYFGVFLGADDSIFDTDLNVPLNLMAHAGNSGSCSVSDASLDVTFHPCV